MPIKPDYTTPIVAGKSLQGAHSQTFIFGWWVRALDFTAHIDSTFTTPIYRNFDKGNANASAHEFFLVLL